MNIPPEGATYKETVHEAGGKKNRSSDLSAVLLPSQTHAEKGLGNTAR